MAVAKAWERLEAAQAEFETAAREATALMPANDIATMTGVPAREVRAAAKRADEPTVTTDEASTETASETSEGA